MSKFTEFSQKRVEWAKAMPELKHILTSTETRRLEISARASGCDKHQAFVLHEAMYDDETGEGTDDNITLTIDQLREALQFAEDCLKEEKPL